MRVVVRPTNRRSMIGMHGVRDGVRAALAIVLILAGATVGMLVAGARGGQAPKPAPGLRADRLPGGLAGSPAPRIRLVDQHGGRVDSTRLGGRPYLVTFLYTHCTDVCPVIGSEIGDALRQLGRRADGVDVLGVSVDPRGDTAAGARAWAAQHRLGPPFHYLLGSSSALTPVWRDWFVVGASGALDDPRTHAAAVWLVDGAGHLRGRWSGGRPIAPADIAHDLRVLLDET